MCPASEGEHAYLVARELREIQEKWKAHKDGLAPLTEDELRNLAIQKLMLMEG